jgi:TfoX/Sxy family transcriptional regulator of competence genes
MASSTDTVQYICDQVGLGRRLAFKKMFGEFALYLDGTIVALVCDDQLFLKPTEKGRAFLGQVKEAPPYPGAKSYFLLTVELDEPDRLREAVLVTAKALPEPKPKVAKAAKNTSVGKQSSNRLKAPAKGAGKKRKSKA